MSMLFGTLVLNSHFLRFCHSDDNHQFYWEISWQESIEMNDRIKSNKRSNERIIKIQTEYACLGKAAPISIEHRYLLSKCNYGDVFKVHKHKKKLCVCVCVDVDWKLNSRHKNWVCPFLKSKEKQMRRIKILIINLTQSNLIYAMSNMLFCIVRFTDKFFPRFLQRSFQLWMFWSWKKHASTYTHFMWLEILKMTSNNRTYVWLKNRLNV